MVSVSTRDGRRRPRSPPDDHDEKPSATNGIVHFSAFQRRFCRLHLLSVVDALKAV
jgi:hypothetical protein